MAPIPWVSGALSPRVQQPWCEAHHFIPDETEFTLHLNMANLFNQKNVFTMYNIVQYVFVLVRSFWSYQQGIITVVDILTVTLYNSLFFWTVKTVHGTIVTLNFLLLELLPVYASDTSCGTVYTYFYISYLQNSFKTIVCIIIIL